MRRIAIAFMLVQGSRLGAQQAPPAPAPADSVAIVGDWQLDLARTHYGPSVDVRRRERFTCTAEGRLVRCVIRSTRADGRELTGRFAAPLDGRGASVTGVPDVDEVRVSRPSVGLLDATFLVRGKPVFGYRAMRSQDGRSLMIVAVDPVSRVARNTIVVYDRR
jgi:hypothetical protein